MSKEVCPVCNSNAELYEQKEGFEFYVCPTCGRIELPDNFNMPMLDIDINHLASYFAYHCYKNFFKRKSDYRYNTLRDKKWCDKYKEEYNNGNNTQGMPIHVDKEIVDAWYPKTYAEKIDQILLYFDKCSEHIGGRININKNLLQSILFIDRKQKSYTSYGDLLGHWELRGDECSNEINFMLDYLKEEKYIKTIDSQNEDEESLVLLPNGYRRIEDLQRNLSNSRNVFVAMKFGDDTEKLREKIREGINKAGYIAIYIDEVNHNDFITPELLKHIKQSKFVVVDLTHKNNGAYFEEGYAMGLGKPVIQLCKKSVDLHFDVAQKNTIMWDTEDSIPEKLANRIKATID